MAELEDAQDLGSCAREGVRVRLPLLALGKLDGGGFRVTSYPLSSLGLVIFGLEPRPLSS